MADKSPKKTNQKKAGKSLKEKRAVKKQKHDASTRSAHQLDALRTKHESLSRRRPPPVTAWALRTNISR